MHPVYPFSIHLRLFNGFALTLLLLTVGALSSNAQEIRYFEEWVAQESAEITEVQNELLQRVVSITDSYNNLYVAASTFNETSGVHDLLITKYNNRGEDLWHGKFNISGGGDVLVGAISLDGSNNVIVTGAVLNGTNNYDVLTVKYNTSGTYQWHGLYSGSASHYDGGTAVTTDGSGNIYVAGVSTESTTNMDFVTIKYNSSGTKQWVNLYDSDSLTDIAAKIIFISGNIRVIGSVQKNVADWAIVYIPYNASTGAAGTPVEISPDDVVVDQINGFTTDGDGDIYIAGSVQDSASKSDFMIIKLDSTLQILWEAYEDGGSNEDDVAKAVAVDESGNVYVTGYATTSTKRDFMTIKYNSSGTKQWAVFYNDKKGWDDEGSDIAVDGNNNIFVTGFSNETGNTDFHTFWLDNSNGDILWDARFNSVYNRDDRAAVLRIDEAGDLLVTGRIVALDIDSEESTEVTTVKYKRAEIIIPPDTVAQSSGIYYIKNNGQLLNTNQDSVPDIKFYSDQTYPGLFFFDDKVSMVLSLIDDDTASVDTTFRVDMSFALSSRSYVMALEEREDYHNYYRGHIPEGRERVPLYQRVVHINAFEDIDIHYTSNAAGLKYDLVVKPGADPGDIELIFDGQTGLNVNGNGELVIETSIGDIILPEPKAYQIDNGEEEQLMWTPEYDVNGSVVTFTTDTYNDEKPLVIKIGSDPEEGAECEVSSNGIEYSTYYGGSGPDFFTDICAAVPTQESVLPTYVYISGQTYSEDFPAIIGDLELYGIAESILIKMQNLQRIWVTYLAGNENYEGGAGWTWGDAIAADHTHGKVWIAGSTTCVDLPITGSSSGYQGDGPPDLDGKAYVAKLSSTGVLEYAAYFGDTDCGNTSIYTIAIRYNGNVFFGGGNNSSGDPTNNTAFYQDPDDDGWAFIAELDQSNQLVWSTRFGEPQALIHDLTIDDEGNLIVVGGYNFTTVPDDPLLDFEDPGGNALFEQYGQGSEEAFIAKFTINSNSRTLYWSTLITGSGDEGTSKVATNSDNEIFCIGGTTSSSMAGLTFSNSYHGGGDLFIIKFSSDGEPLKSIFHGGSNSDGAYNLSGDDGLAIDGESNVYIASTTRSDEDFPTLELAGVYYQDILGNNALEGDLEDATVIVTNKDLEDVWVTYFGGRADVIEDEYGTGILVSSDRIYFVGVTHSHCSRKIPLKDAIPFSNYFNGELDLGMNDVLADGFITTFEPLVITNVIQKENPAGDEMIVFPSPSNNAFFLEIPRYSGYIQIKLLDLFGRVLFSNELNWNLNSKIEINTASLPSGTYLLTANTQNKTLTDKVIVQHN